MQASRLIGVARYLDILAFCRKEARPPGLGSIGMERILTVGGGIVGSCIAYHLALAGAAAAVTVVEPDPSYKFAATPRAVGAIRLQHSLREDVEMSLYGAQVYSAFAEHV